jgi:hypothetical protein
VVAEFVPGGVGAYLDALDLGGPGLGEEDVVDVVEAIFVVGNRKVGLVATDWDSEKIGKDLTQRSTETQRTHRRGEKDKRDFIAQNACDGAEVLSSQADTFA